MLQWGLISLDKLDAAKETKRSVKVQMFAISNPPFIKITIPINLLDLELAAALIAYDSSNSF